MSNVKKSNTWTMEEVHKIINWHNEVHTYVMSILMSHMMVTKNPQNVHRKCFWTILVTFIFDIKIDVIMCEPHYVNLFFMNLFHSLCVWLFDIWHLFDNLTSFWQLDIFLTTLHLFWYVQQDTWAMGHMGKGVSCVILKIEMGYLGGWGTWAMGHMGNRAHDHNVGKFVSWLILKIEMGHLGGWGTWSMWSCAWSCATSLILHFDIS